MIFTETRLSGVYIIKCEKHVDKRGFFVRIWDQSQFKKYGLSTKLVQCNISYNKKKGTLRGMHYQVYPHQVPRLVGCIRGKIFDVIIDLRPNSKTFKDWIGVELTTENQKMTYVPKGFAHGFETLEDNTEVFYLESHYHNVEYTSGTSWNDPAFKIRWPIKPVIISKKDLSYKPFSK